VERPPRRYHRGKSTDVVPTGDEVKTALMNAGGSGVFRSEQMCISKNCAYETLPLPRGKCSSGQGSRSTQQTQKRDGRKSVSQHGTPRWSTSVKTAVQKIKPLPRRRRAEQNTSGVKTREGNNLDKKVRGRSGGPPGRGCALTDKCKRTLEATGDVEGVFRGKGQSQGND